jgi:hypothetical protein
MWIAADQATVSGTATGSASSLTAMRVAAEREANEKAEAANA